MNLNWLKTFVTLAETRSFSRTARELNLTQPAVSKHIAALESLFGTKLFDRSRRSVTLTEAGNALLPYAQKILTALVAATEEISSFAATVKGTLIIGASTIPGHYVLPPLIQRFRHQYPEVTVNLQIADTGQIVQRVLAGDLLLGAVGALKPLPALEAIPFAEDEIVLVLPENHPLAQNPTLDPTLLSELEFVWRERESGTRHVVEKELEKAGINPANLKIVAELSTTEAVLAAVEAGMGASFVSRRAAEKRARNGLLTLHRLHGVPLTRKLYLVHLRNRFLPPPVTAFIDFARQ